MAECFERGVVLVSIDTERIWGYLDCLNETQFEARFPGSPLAHRKLLARLTAAGVSATWFVVGGLARRSATVLPDYRFAGAACGHLLRRGGESAGPLWHCRPFLERLRAAKPEQEIGLHGGLTHLVWTDAQATRETVLYELQDGIQALSEACGQPRSFSYPRGLEAYHELLPQQGIRCFRGGPPGLAWRLGRTMPGAVLRAWEELRRATPPLVMPLEVVPGLWSIPASLFLYPIGPARARLIGLRSRIDRFRRGIEAATRHRSIFHFCFHPENLVESRCGFSLLDDMLERLVRARSRGDIEIMTMSDVVARIERTEPYAFQQQQYPELFETHRRAHPAAAHQSVRPGL
jgi:hypothetical protein